MDQLTGTVTLVALHGFFSGPITRVEPAQALAAEDVLDRGRRQSGLVSDMVSTPPPLFTQPNTLTPLRL